MSVISAMVESTRGSVILKFSDAEMNDLEAVWRRGSRRKSFNEWLHDWIILELSIDQVRRKLKRSRYAKTVKDLRIGTLFGKSKRKT